MCVCVCVYPVCILQLFSLFTNFVELFVEYTNLPVYPFPLHRDLCVRYDKTARYFHCYVTCIFC